VVFLGFRSTSYLDEQRPKFSSGLQNADLDGSGKIAETKKVK